MSGFTVEYDSQEEIVRVEMRGEFDAALLSASTSAFVEEVRRSGCTRILMNHLHAKPKLSVIEQYERPTVAAKLGVPRHSRIAIVCQEFDQLYQFIETVGVNQGFSVKVFTEMEAALHWLKRRNSLA